MAGGFETEKMVKQVESAGCPVLMWTIDVLSGRNAETGARLARTDTRNCTSCPVAHPIAGSRAELNRARPMFSGNGLDLTSTGLYRNHVALNIHVTSCEFPASFLLTLQWELRGGLIKLFKKWSAACFLLGAATLSAAINITPYLQRPGLHPNLAPGVSLRVSSQPLEYDWILAPGANPDVIRMDFRGSPVSIGKDGQLQVGRNCQHSKPKAFQSIHGKRVPIPAEFRIFPNDVVGFTVGSFDPRHEVIIDPVVAYSVTLGGSGADEIKAVTSDAQGYTYVAGTARSKAFPVTEGAFQPEQKGGADMYVAKLDRDGKRLLFSTLLGGSAEDYVQSIAVDAEGNVYVAGITYSSKDFPGLTPHSPDAQVLVITKVRSDGKAILFTFGFEAYFSSVLTGMAVDQAGNVHFGGWGLVEMPVARNSFQPQGRGGGDAFVGKLNSSGKLIYFGMLGGSMDDKIRGVASDSEGNTYVAGVTVSADFPTTPGAFQEQQPGDTCMNYCIRGFVAKINAEGTALVYSTYLGGSNQFGVDGAYAIGVDAEGNAYVTGRITSIDFPVTPDALQPRLQPETMSGPGSAFLTKLDPSGSQLLYSTYLNGGRQWDDFGLYLMVAGNNVYLSGVTASLSFPEVNPVQAGRGDQRSAQGQVIRCGDPNAPLRYCWDTFLTVFDTASMQLVFSTYLGWVGDDVPVGLGVDGHGDAVVAGNSSGGNGFGRAVPLPESKTQWNYITKVGMEGTAPLVRVDWFVESATLNAAWAGYIGGLMTTIFGKNITAREGVIAASGFPLPTEIDGISVELGGRRVPLYSVSKVNGVEQINFLSPYDLAPSAPTGLDFIHVIVNNNGNSSLPLIVQLLEDRKDIPKVIARFFLQDNGDAQAVHASDGSLITKENPARRGEVITLFGTGFGPVQPPVRAGDAAPAEPRSWTLSVPSVRFGDAAADDVIFCGLTPGLAGLYQVDVSVPAGAPSGKVAVTLRSPGAFYTPTTIQVE